MEHPCRSQVHQEQGQNFALREDIGQRVRLDQEISTQKFFQKAFSGDKIASHADHERKHKEPPRGTQEFRVWRGNTVNWPPIPYVEPAEPNRKQETTKIKVKLPDKTTTYQMVPFWSGTNESYVTHAIAVKQLLE